MLAAVRENSLQTVNVQFTGALTLISHTSYDRVFFLTWLHTWEVWMKLYLGDRWVANIMLIPVHGEPKRKSIVPTSRGLEKRWLCLRFPGRCIASPQTSCETSFQAKSLFMNLEQKSTFTSTTLKDSQIIIASASWVHTEQSCENPCPLVSERAMIWTLLSYSSRGGTEPTD